MRRLFTIMLLATAAAAAAAGPLEQARQLYNEGRYDEALVQLQTLQRKSPRDGSTNYWLAATLAALDRAPEARKYYGIAEERGVADAALALARLDVDAYDPASAADHYDNYTRLMRKNKRTVPADVEQEQASLLIMENMLSRVERVEVIDSLVVDADEFFTAYRLSPEAGRLVTGVTARLPEAEMAFLPENNTEILYSQPDSTGTYVLMGADILDDGSVDHARPLDGDNLAGGGNAEYPFMLSDGTTLYFAADGEGSLGGYDIFLTRRDEDNRYLQPQNIGMPFNSPDDDYLMAIDETAGIGWWATDRNHIPGKVTIYIFVPSDTRVNVDADAPDLVARARLSDITSTREPGKDYSALLDRIASIGTADSDSRAEAAPAFELPIGSTTLIYHSLRDFKSPQARQLMARAIDARAGIVKAETRLAALREAYHGGDHSHTIAILDLEDELAAARSRYDDLVNKAIAAELKKL